MNKQEIIDSIPDGWEIHDNNGFIHIYNELENSLIIDGIIKGKKVQRFIYHYTNGRKEFCYGIN